jgi:hypothetical protein
MERGCEVVVLTGTDPLGRTQVDLNGVKVHFLLEGRSTRVSRDQFVALVEQKFSALHAERPFDLVHSIDHSAVGIARLRGMYRVAVAYDASSTHMSELFAILGFEQDNAWSVIKTLGRLVTRFVQTYFTFDRSLLATADGLFVNSPRERLTLERYYLYPDFKMHNVSYGVELAELGEPDDPAPLREKLGLTSAAQVAVTESDMRDIGEMLSILQAFETISIRKPNARLLVIGDGPQMRRIEYETLMLALGSKVHFLGEVRPQDLPQCIALADVFVSLSARSTGFEPSLLEAMAQGKTVIGSELSSIASVIDNGINGHLVRPADVVELSQLILDSLQPEGAAVTAKLEMGRAAQTKVRELFNPGKMIDDTLEAYRRILRSIDRPLVKRATRAAPGEDSAQLNRDPEAPSR